MTSERSFLEQLEGIAYTMLSPLQGRAREARRPDALLVDPDAIRIADAIGPGVARQFEAGGKSVSRALVYDRVMRDWIRRHPGGTVVALGDGLETQTYRVDDGTVEWIAVDLPEAIAVRRRFIPDSARRRSIACSALDPSWMQEVRRNRAVMITAQGVLFYFQPEEVRQLVASIAGSFPGAEMIFCAVPRGISRRSFTGVSLGPGYRFPPMPWGLDPREVPSLKGWHPAIESVRRERPERGRGFRCGWLIPFLHRAGDFWCVSPYAVSMKLAGGQ